MTPSPRGCYIPLRPRLVTALPPPWRGPASAPPPRARPSLPIVPPGPQSSDPPLPSLDLLGAAAVRAGLSSAAVAVSCSCGSRCATGLPGGKQSPPPAAAFDPLLFIPFLSCAAADDSHPPSTRHHRRRDGGLHGLGELPVTLFLHPTLPSGGAAEACGEVVMLFISTSGCACPRFGGA